jgi:hypothetical protein
VECKVAWFKHVFDSSICIGKSLMDLFSLNYDGINPLIYSKYVPILHPLSKVISRSLLSSVDISPPTIWLHQI